MGPLSASGLWRHAIIALLVVHGPIPDNTAPHPHAHHTITNQAHSSGQAAALHLHVHETACALGR